MQGIGDRLRDARVTRGLTQLQLCSATGIAVSTLSNTERGHTRPTLDVIVKIADALGVGVDDLLGRAAGPVEEG